MATGSAALWDILGYHPGNSAFPALPGANDPSVGKTTELSIGANFTLRRTQQPLRRGGGGAGFGFANWYLDQVWTTPQPVDFGSVASEKDVEVNVHNTYRDPIDLESIAVADITGLSVASPALPESVEAFSSLVVTLRAAVSGAQSFDQEIDWTYDVRVVAIRIVGRRVLFFTAQPEAGVREQLVWHTDVMRSKNGTEQVFATRQAPRSIVRMLFRNDDDRTRTRLTNLVLNGSQSLLVGRMSWWDARKITAAVSSSASVVSYDTSDMALAVGDTVVFMTPAGTFVEGEVTSFDGSSVTFTDAIGLDLPLGTYAVPARFGYITQFPRLSIYANNLEDTVLEFTTNDDVYIGAVDASEFGEHPVDSLPIIEANYMEGATKSAFINREIEVLDGGTGILFTSSSEDVGEYGTEVAVVLQSVAKIHVWRRFLHHLRGSYAKFYLPTFQNDLPLASALVLGGTTFSVPNMGLANLGGGAPPRRDLSIQIDTGEVYYRRIASIADNGDTEEVTLTAAIPGSGSSSVAGTRISYLHLCRIRGDVATFTHERPGLAFLQFSVRTCKE